MKQEKVSTRKGRKKLGPASSTVENGLKGSKGGKIYYQSKVRRDLLSNLSLEVGLRFFLNSDDETSFSQKKRVKELLVVSSSARKFLMIFSPQKSEKNSVVGIFL